MQQSGATWHQAIEYEASAGIYSAASVSL